MTEFVILVLLLLACGSDGVGRIVLVGVVLKLVEGRRGRT